MPDNVRPACDSVVAHVFISCIFGILQKLIPIFRRVSRPPREGQTRSKGDYCNIQNTSENL